MLLLLQDEINDLNRIFFTVLVVYVRSPSVPVAFWTTLSHMCSPFTLHHGSLTFQQNIFELQNCKARTRTPLLFNKHKLGLQHWSLWSSCSDHWWLFLSTTGCGEDDAACKQVERHPSSIPAFDARKLQMVSPIIRVEVIQLVNNSECGPNRKA